MTTQKSSEISNQKRSGLLGKLLSTIFFFIFAPKLIRGAWEMGRNYTYGENSLGFIHLTEKGTDGNYKGKYRTSYLIGIIATFILTGILCVLGFFIWKSSVSASETVAKLLTIIPAAFAALVVVFIIAFLWAYLCGQISGLREKVAEVNEKLSQGFKIDKFGNIIKTEQIEKVN